MFPMNFGRHQPGCIIAVLMTLVATSYAQAAERPNILFIMSDDHAAHAISAYGGRLSDVCPTPNIDRLANEGLLFTNCFCTNSICTPSRATIFTGKYSHKNGVYKFTPLDQTRQETLPKLLQTHGYHTGFVGKWHLHTNPMGFDFWSILPGQGRYHDPQFVEMGGESDSNRVRDGERTTYRGHSSDVIADKALAFLRSQRNVEAPFLLCCHFKAPHDTWEFAPRYQDFLADRDIPEPLNLLDGYSSRSDALRSTLQYIGSSWGDHTNFEAQTNHLAEPARTKRQYQLYLKKYLRCVKGVDDNVGRVLNYLDATGLADNTLVIYTADQGFFLGEHKLYDKRFMYEEALRMPLLVRWPGHVRAGSRQTAIVLNLDFAPTLLRVAQANVPDDVQGRSFLPMLTGEAPDDWRQSMYYRYYPSHFKTERHRGVRTQQYKLIHFDRIGQWELFDLHADPREMENLYGQPQFSALTAELKEELNRLSEYYDDDLEDVGDRPW